MPAKVTTKGFIKKARKIHGNKYNYSKSIYKNSLNPIKIICKKHGIFKQLPHNHMAGAGCPKCGFERGANLNRMPKEEFIKRAKKIHGKKYKYNLVKYITCDQKIKIICKVHGTFEQTPYGHLTSSGCLKCSGVNKRTHKEFLKKSKEMFGNNFIFLSRYKGAREKIKIKCKKHNYVFWISAWGHYKSKSGGCKKCEIEFMKEINGTKKEEFIKIANKIHKNKYKYIGLPDFFNRNLTIKIRCPIHGVFKQRVDSHLISKGCQKCGAKQISIKMMGDVSELIKKAKKTHNNYYDYDKVIYTGIDDKVAIVCPKHGEFKQSFYSHINRKSKCPRCSKKYSLIEKMWLDSMNIPDDCQHRQVILRIGKNIIKADGFNKNSNTIYELYGDYYHGNPKVYSPKQYNFKSKKTFGELYNKTIEREKMIKKTGYKLITIWEYDFRKQLKLKSYSPRGCH